MQVNTRMNYQEFFYRILTFYILQQYNHNTSEIGHIQNSVQQIPHFFKTEI